MEGVHDRRHEAVEVEAERCAGSRCLEEWHFGEPSNPCKRGNTDVKPMMMMMFTVNHLLSDLPSASAARFLRYGMSADPEANDSTFVTRGPKADKSTSADSSPYRR
jgi:hypothetical protein